MSSDQPPKYHDPSIENTPSPYHLVIARYSRLETDSVTGKRTFKDLLDKGTDAIIIAPNDNWPDVEKLLWERIQLQYPKLVTSSNRSEFSIGMCIQYTAHNNAGTVEDVSSLKYSDNSLFEFLHRKNIDVCKLYVSIAPIQATLQRPSEDPVQQSSKEQSEKPKEPVRYTSEELNEKAEKSRRELYGKGENSRRKLERRRRYHCILQ